MLMLRTPKLKARLITIRNAELDGDRVEPAAAGDHEGGAEEAEDRARGAERERVRVGQQERAEGAGEQRGEVEGDEARRADRRLQQPAEEEEQRTC